MGHIPTYALQAQNVLSTVELTTRLKEDRKNDVQFFTPVSSYSSAHMSMFGYSASGHSDLRHTECLNLTEVRRVKYIYNHKNNVPSRLSQQWLCGNSCTWYLMYNIATVHHVPKCLSYHRDDCIYIYIYIYKFDSNSSTFLR